MTVLAYHPMGGRIACGCNQGMIRIYSTVSGRLLHLRDTTGGAAALDGGGVGGGVGGGAGGVGGAARKRVLLDHGVTLLLHVVSSSLGM